METQKQKQNSNDSGGESKTRESLSDRWVEDFVPPIDNLQNIDLDVDEENPNSKPSPGNILENVNSGLNERLIQKIEAAQKNLLLCTSDYYSWSPLYLKDGVEAFKRSTHDGIMCVKGQTLLPYSIKEIFEVLSDIRFRKIIEPTVETCCPIKPLSNHSGIEYLKFKGIWPTAPRDFCNLLHWRLLKSGIFLYFAFDEPSNHFPERAGVVRGHLHLGGYVMKHVHGGTMISLVVQVDIGGSVPQSVANLVLVNKTLILLNLRKLLDQKYESYHMNQLSSISPPNYEELLNVANQTTFSTNLTTPLEPEEYVIPNSRYTLSNHSSPLDTPIKEGHLYKQSDHLKIWNSRYFILTDHFLHYYFHKHDTIPRMSLQMIYGIKITTHHEPKVINGYQLYQFTISHPETSSELHLATTLEEREIWIATIQRIVNGELISPSICDENEGVGGDLAAEFASNSTSASGSTSTSHNETKEQSSQQQQQQQQHSNKSHINTPNEPVNSHLLDYGVPIEFKEKIDSIASTILEYSSPEFTQDWPVMYEKDGVKGCRRPGSGLICVRGESLLPYSIPEIFGLALNPNMKKVVDPNVDVYERGKWYNYHTGHEYMKSKGSWPTSPRDFSNGTHWRLLKNGKFLNFAFDHENSEFPEQNGVVRAKLIFGGYVMKHVIGGTQMTFILQVDIGGSVPLAIANFVGQSKPMTLATLHKVLNQMTKGKLRPNFMNPIPPSYEELLQAVFDSGAMLPNIQKSIKAQLETIELQTESQSAIELVQEIPSEASPQQSIKETEFPVNDWTLNSQYISHAHIIQKYRLVLFLVLLGVCSLIFIKSIQTLILIGFTVLLWQLFFGLSKDSTGSNKSSQHLWQFELIQQLPFDHLTSQNNGKNKYDLIIRAIIRTVSSLKRKNISSISNVTSHSMFVLMSSSAEQHTNNTTTSTSATTNGFIITNLFNKSQTNQEMNLKDDSLAISQNNNTTTINNHKNHFHYIPILFNEIIKFFFEDYQMAVNDISSPSSHFITLIIISSQMSPQGVNEINYSQLSSSQLKGSSSPIIITINSHNIPHNHTRDGEREDAVCSNGSRRGNKDSLMDISVCCNSTIPKEEGEMFAKKFKENLEYQKIEI